MVIGAIQNLNKIVKERVMEFNEFLQMLVFDAKKIGISIDEQRADTFYKYMQQLLEWNEKINLTAITEPKDIILKHFIDSITIEKYIKKNAKVVDIGTGAGFPGIPLAIIRKDVDITLMDSLNKRIKFLNEVIAKNNLSHVMAVHGRAEELAISNEYREQFDIATSRAVASLNVLLEYMLPFVRVGGYCICMKGANIEEEKENSKRALELLGGTIEKIDSFVLPNTEFGRSVVIVKKIGSTPKKYPRKAGTPAKEPL